MSTRTEKIFQALADAGWVLLSKRAGGVIHTYTHPACAQEIPTPELVPHASWPFSTYHPLRQVSLLFAKDGTVSKVWKREGTPWQGSNEGPLSVSKALEFIRETYAS